MSAYIKLHCVQASLGDSFFLQFLPPSGTENQCWFVDGGPGFWVVPGSYKKAINSLFGAINDLDIKTLDRFIVTHNDFDVSAR